MITLFISLVFAVTVSHGVHPCRHGLGECSGFSSVPLRHHFPTHRQQTIERVLANAYDSAASRYDAHPDASSQGVFRPSDFGGDPTGLKDSSDAFDKLIDAMFPHSSLPMTDIGGAFLDLTGATYTVSRPIVIPAGFSGYSIGGGQLNAAESFPAGATLLDIAPSSAEKGHGVLNLDISRLTINGTSTLGTALSVLNGQYVNIGPAV